MKARRTFLALLGAALMLLTACSKAFTPEQFFNQFTPVSECKYSTADIFSAKRSTVMPAELQAFGIAQDTARYGHSQVFYADIIRKKAYYAVTFIISTDNYQTRWGRVISELLLATFTPEGNPIEQRVIAKFSHEHLSDVKISSLQGYDADELFVFVDERTILDLGETPLCADVSLSSVVFADGTIRQDVFDSSRHTPDAAELEQLRASLGRKAPLASNAAETEAQARLLQAYAALQAAPDSLELHRAFMAAMPKRWEEFADVYTYHIEKEFSNQAFFALTDHLQSLESQLHLAPESLAGYYVGLASEAEELQCLSSCDDSYRAMDVLQQRLWALMAADPDLVITELQRMPTERWAHFWSYYFAVGDNFYGELNPQERDRLAQHLVTSCPAMLPALHAGFDNRTFRPVHIALRK